MKAVVALALIALPHAALLAQSAVPPRGAILFLQCRSCHSIKAGEPHKIGPNLGGVAGAAAASKQGYAYSAALGAATFRWTDARLDAFLASPATAVPGTKMVLVGVKRPEDRVVLIDYLKTGGRQRIVVCVSEFGLRPSAPLEPDPNDPSTPVARFVELSVRVNGRSVEWGGVRGTVRRTRQALALSAAAQVQRQAAESASLLHLLTRGDLPRCDAVREVPALAAEC
jgi:cytochrome c